MAPSRIYIERAGPSEGGRWRKFSERGYRGRTGSEVHTTATGFRVDRPFGTLGTAVMAVAEFRQKNLGAPQMRIVQYSHVLWVEDGHSGRGHEVLMPATTTTTTPQEDHMLQGPSDLEQPLHIPRQAVIDTLQKNLDAEKAERDKAQQAITTRRQAAQDAVGSLSAEELLNLVQKHVNSDLDDIVDMVDEAKKSGRLKNQPIPAGPKETELEKYVRVLSLANDDVIEVKPGSPIYPLL